MRRDIKILSPKYLDFIRSKPCLVSHSHIGGTDAHHVIARGWRNSKQMDLSCLPLCRSAHVEIEQIGVEKFSDKYDVNIWRELFWLLVEFAVSQGWVKTKEK